MNKTPAELKFGIVTISDRASRGQYADRGGPEVLRYLQEVVTSPFQLRSSVISDDYRLIVETLIRLADEEACQLIITTGGTGPAWRDVTPEATEEVCQKLMPGFGEQMRAVSLTKVPTAILSRQTAGIRSSENRGSLIINLPGSPKAIRECLDAIFAAVPYCVDLINPQGPSLQTDPEKIVAFRPKS
jgi:molybdopterin adenylyltransferase